MQGFWPAVDFAAVDCAAQSITEGTRLDANDPNRGYKGRRTENVAGIVVCSAELLLSMKDNQEEALVCIFYTSQSAADFDNLCQQMVDKIVANSALQRRLFKVARSLEGNGSFLFQRDLFHRFQLQDLKARSTEESMLCDDCYTRILHKTVMELSCFASKPITAAWYWGLGSVGVSMCSGMTEMWKIQNRLWNIERHLVATRQPC